MQNLAYKPSAYAQGGFPITHHGAKTHKILRRSKQPTLEIAVLVRVWFSSSPHFKDICYTLLNNWKTHKPYRWERTLYGMFGHAHDKHPLRISLCKSLSQPCPAVTSSDLAFFAFQVINGTQRLTHFMRYLRSNSTAIRDWQLLRMHLEPIAPEFTRDVTDCLERGRDFIQVGSALRSHRWHSNSSSTKFIRAETQKLAKNYF